MCAYCRPEVTFTVVYGSTAQWWQQVSTAKVRTGLSSAKIYIEADGPWGFPLRPHPSHIPAEHLDSASLSELDDQPVT